MNNQNNSNANTNNKVVNERAIKNALKKAEKAEKLAKVRNNKELLNRYIKELDVSDKVRNHIDRRDLSFIPERVSKLTKFYKRKEYNRIKKLYPYYFK